MSIFSARLDQDPLKSFILERYKTRGGLPDHMLTNFVYELCECQLCHTIFQRYIPDARLMSAIYNPVFDDETIKRKTVRKANAATPHRHKTELRILFSQFPKPPRILDFGVGWGHWAKAAKSLGADVSGTELDQERANLAREAGISIINYNDLPNHEFDLINTEQVFEHLPQPLETLTHLSKALAPNGCIKVSVPNSHGVESGLRNPNWKSEHLNPIEPLQHINCFRRRSLTAMGRKAGLCEKTLPLNLQYKYLRYINLKELARDLLTPINRNILKRSNYVIFTRPGHATAQPENQTPQYAG